MGLTNKFGVNYKGAYVTIPSVKIHQGENGGRERTLVETFVLDADAADQDTVIMGRLPPGAKVLGARLFGADLGGAGTLRLGTSASVDGSLTDAAAPQGIIVDADSSGQAYDVSDGASAAMRGASVGLVRNATEVNITLLFNGVTSAATGKQVTMILKYIVE